MNRDALTVQMGCPSQGRRTHGRRRPPSGERPTRKREAVLTDLLRFAGKVTHRNDLTRFSRLVAERLRDTLEVVECDVVGVR